MEELEAEENEDDSVDFLSSDEESEFDFNLDDLDLDDIDIDEDYEIGSDSSEDEE